LKIVSRKILLAVVASTMLVSGASQAADKLPVTTSFSILGDLVHVVGGDRVSVTTLVAIVQSRLFAINGLGFEHWAQKLAKSAGYKGETLVASKGVNGRTMADEKGHAEADPHAWQDPTNVVLYVRNIAATLSKLDPAGAATFQRNSDAYVKELQALDAWAKEQFAAIPADKRKVITSHDAFGYFAAHYQIKFLAPQGISTEAEPSAKAVAQLIRQIKREKIKAVFLENMNNPKLLEQLSKDAGVTVGPSLYADALSSADKPGATYLQMMRHNVTQLAAGMKLN
jgi:zinc/manganese transport system substrate-binding protein